MTLGRVRNPFRSPVSQSPGFFCARSASLKLNAGQELRLQSIWLKTRGDGFEHHLPHCNSARAIQFSSARSTSGEVTRLSLWSGWVRIPHASLILRGRFCWQKCVALTRESTGSNPVPAILNSAANTTIRGSIVKRISFLVSNETFQVRILIEPFSILVVVYSGNKVPRCRFCRTLRKAILPTNVVRTTTWYESLCTAGLSGFYVCGNHSNWF